MQLRRLAPLARLPPVRSPSVMGTALCHPVACCHTHSCCGHLFPPCQVEQLLRDCDRVQMVYTPDAAYRYGHWPR